MDTRSKLVIAALLASVCGPLFAGYVSAVPAPAFTGSPGAYLYRAAANDVVYQGMIRTAEGGTLNLAGQAVKMPAAMRFAANSGGFLARSVFLNPWLAIGAGAAALAYEYYTRDGGFALGSDGKWQAVTHGVECASGCIDYRIAPNVATAPWAHSQQLAANYMMGRVANGYPVTAVRLESGNRFSWFTGQYSGTWFGPYPLESQSVPPYNTSTTRPATEEEFKGHAYPLPFPDGLPQVAPDPDSPGKIIPLPVEDPVILPNPQPVPNPYPEPTPGRHPLRIPLSDPVPVPAPVPEPVPYTPTWKQPVIDVVPSPIPGDPWRIDLQPRDIVTESPDPLPIAPPVIPPPGSTTPAPTETPPDLCVQHPEIIACQKFTPDEVAPIAVPNANKNLTITKDTGWGPSSGTCPAPKVITVMGKTLSFSLQILCDLANGIKPLFIALAWVSAALMFIGFGRKS